MESEKCMTFSKSLYSHTLCKSDVQVNVDDIDQQTK